MRFLRIAKSWFEIKLHRWVLLDSGFWGDLLCVCVAALLYLQLWMVFVYTEVVEKGKANFFCSMFILNPDFEIWVVFVFSFLSLWRLETILAGSILGPSGFSAEISLCLAAELPPPYTAIASPDASGVPVINCRVCQSLINLDGKLHQHVVKCTVCNEATVKGIF